MGPAALFPGSFDPFTNGHYEIAKRALKLFERVVIAMGYNPEKQRRCFDPQVMAKIIRTLFANDTRIKVLVYDRLTAELAAEEQTAVLVRGLRNTTDFEFENRVSQLNHRLNPSLETVFLITSPENSTIASSLVRELYRYGGDLKPYLPYELPPEAALDPS